MNWIDIPACRILEISSMEAREQFEFLGEGGGPLKEYSVIYRAIRKSDSRVFKTASFIPIDSFGRDCYYLQEL